MTTIDTTADHPAPAAAASAGRDGATSLVAAWVTSADHKRIGRLFIGTGLLALLATIVVGVLLGVERIDATSFDLLDEGSTAQLFAIFRIGLALGVALPLLLGLAIAVVPLQLGARAIAFPRVALFGFWAWLAGLAMVIVAIARNGGPGGGDADMVDLYLVGIGFVAIGLTAAATAVATTVLTTRAPGMWLHRVPLLAWSALVSSIGVVLTMPVLLGDVVYLFLDHRNGRLAFGGNAGLSEWSGWALTQPQSYVYAIVGLGVLADIVPVMARRRQPARSGMLVAIALVGVAALAGVTQKQHTLPWPGDGFTDQAGDKVQALVPYLLFNGLPVLGVLVVLVLAADVARRGRPRMLSPVVWALLGVGLVLTGMLGHLVSLFEDAGLQGTVFEEAELVYVGYGAVMAALGGVAFWGPKLWGRRLADGPVTVLGLLCFLGVVLASLPFFIAGFADQPAEVLGGFDYSGPQDLWNALVAVGHGLVLVAVVGFVALAVRGFTAGESAGDDPWDGQTLEWATSSPPPADNFAEIATVLSAEPLLDLKRSGSDA